MNPFTNQTILSYTNGDGTTGTDISANYRIPALVTLPDGTLVAAADARWDTYYDGGGLDTAVAYSKDNGKTWTSSIANYLGDNGNVWCPQSSTFIDPSLAVDGDTVYMLVDLYPYAIALNGAKLWPIPESAGFNADGKLLLIKGTRTIREEDYTYYLGDKDEMTGYAPIVSNTGEAVAGYAVDGKFNLFSVEDGAYRYLTNLFVKNGIFEVIPTAYLYLTSSKDGGKTWSDPQLLTCKKVGELACLVGPGRGIKTSKGMILFPCYSFQPQQSAFIYSLDSGNTWTRFEGVETDGYWSGESTFVELENGNLRCVFRTPTCRICYADVICDENGVPVKWDEPVKTEFRNNSNTQICAMSYSKKIDGCQAILISCCTGKWEEGSDSCDVVDRLNGKIFAALVKEDGTFDLKYSLKMTEKDGFFAYSCLTELSDGNIALLYEKGPTELSFVTVNIRDIVGDAEITESFNSCHDVGVKRSLE